MAFDVFISYSSRNKLIADAMKQYLQSKGIRCWKAPDDIVHGESWAAAIPRAIKNSQIMVLIWTVDSMNSRQVVNELTLADRAKKLIIPFRTEPIEPENEFEYYLAKTHWFDAFGSNNDDDFELLSERVMRNLDESARPSAQESVSSGIGYSLASFQGKQVVSPLEPTAPLIGSRLLAKVKELGDASKSELVRACGYVSTRKDGGELLNFQAFYEALLDAKEGVQFASPEQEISSDEQNDQEKELDYRLTTAPDGSLLYTSSYTCLHDLLPGDEFDVILGTASIVLAPRGWEEDEELGDELSVLGTNRTWLVTVDSQNNIRIPTEALSALGAHPGQQFMVRLRRKLIKLEVIAKGASNDGISDLATTENYFNNSEASWTENAVCQARLDTPSSPLQGDELIAKVKALGDASNADLVRSCGYASSIRSGGEYLNFAAFFDALLEAKGVLTERTSIEEAEVINLHESAKAKINKGDSTGAVQLLDHAIIKASTANILDSDLYYDRSLALSSIYRKTEALADISLAIEMSEEPEALYYRLRGLIHEELGDLALACADWRVAAELGDTDSRQWFDGQCSCQDSVGESRLTEAISIPPQEAEGIAPVWDGPGGSQLDVQCDRVLPTFESTFNDTLENIDKQIKVIVAEAEEMSGESAFKSSSHYRLNPDKGARLLGNHSLSDKSDSIYMFFGTGIVRAKNGLLITDQRISIKDFWEKPVHFDYFREGEGLLMVLIGASSEKIEISIYRNRGDKGACHVHDLGLSLHNLLGESTRVKYFLQRRIPELIELLGKRQEKICLSGNEVSLSDFP